MSITRRHFLISGASLLGACLLPASFLRRLDRLTDNPAAAIDAPSHARATLYATLQDCDRWQLALGRPTTAFPSAPSWREWLADYESVDPEDERAVAAWFSRGARPRPHGSPVDRGRGRCRHLGELPRGPLPRLRLTGGSRTAIPLTPKTRPRPPRA
jgi:hypothetical protein